MNIQDLSVRQLRRAAAIKEKLGSLSKELRNILGTSSNSGAMAKNHRTMNASARRKIAAAQKARWAKLRRAKVGPGKPVARKKMSAAARAKLSAKMKRYWAAKKAAKK